MRTPRSIAALLPLTTAFTLATASAGCGDEAPTPLGCGPTSESGFYFGHRCSDEALRLLPSVRVGTEWHGAGLDGGCAVSGDVVSCPAGGAGVVELVHDPATSTVRARFVASTPATVTALALVGEGYVRGERGMVVDGFQSWSASGVIAIPPTPTDEDVDLALHNLDNNRFSDGKQLSWFWTAVGGGGPTLLVGATTTARWKPWVQLTRDDPSSPTFAIRAVSGMAGESVSVAAGGVVEGETFRLDAGSAETVLTAYGRSLPTFDDGRPERTRADVGWNSWYQLFDTVSEADVLANATLARERLAPLAPAGSKLRIVVDDGWQMLWGEWTPNAKFPRGLSGLAADLHGQGFEVGVWLAPMLVDADSTLVSAHPDWFLPNARYVHPKHGDMRVLDVTQPDARAHLASVISTIVAWGYDFLKIDFLFAAALEATRAQAVTGFQAYHLALETIRTAAGPDTILLAVGAPGQATLPHVNAWRVGGDIVLEPIGPMWSFTVDQLRSVALRYPLCTRILCDADPLIQRMGGAEMTTDEVDVGSWVVALSGGAYFLSDDQRTLPEARRSLGLDARRVSLGTGGVPAFPLDYFPETPPTRLANPVVDWASTPGSSTEVAPSLYRLPDGGRLAIDVTDEAVRIAGHSVPPHGAVVLP